MQRTKNTNLYLLGYREECPQTFKLPFHFMLKSRLVSKRARVVYVLIPLCMICLASGNIYGIVHFISVLSGLVLPWDFCHSVYWLLTMLVKNICNLYSSYSASYFFFFLEIPIISSSWICLDYLSNSFFSVFL